jgi:hypothetical protein
MIKGASLVSQLLRHFPRTEFAHLAAKHEAEKRAKGLTCRTQLVPMLFYHMAHADSLREICGCSIAQPSTIYKPQRAQREDEKQFFSLCSLWFTVFSE